MNQKTYERFEEDEYWLIMKEVERLGIEERKYEENYILMREYEENYKLMREYEENYKLMREYEENYKLMREYEEFVFWSNQLVVDENKMDSCFDLKTSKLWPLNQVSSLFSNAKRDVDKHVNNVKTSVDTNTRNFNAFNKKNWENAGNTSKALIKAGVTAHSRHRENLLRHGDRLEKVLRFLN